MTYSPPQIGQLRERLALEKPVSVSDGAGGVTTTWTLTATLWAHMAPSGGNESQIADHLDGVVTHTVTMRYRDDIRNGDRLRLGPRIFRVLAAHDADETGRFLICRVEEEGR